MRRFFLALSALALLAVPARAQEYVLETQIPLAPELGILEITPELDRELIFTRDGRGEFLAFRLFRLSDGTMIEEMSWLVDGAIVREREVVSEERLAMTRAMLATKVAEAGLRPRRSDQSGRTGLVLAETLLGVGFYGWAVPVGFDIDSSRGAVAAYLLTSGLSFYLPYALTRGASVSVAERNSAVWGATRGALHGLFLGELLEGEPEPNDFGGGADIRALAATGTSIAETVIAYQLVDAANASEGEVAFWGAGGDFGIPFGFGLAYLSGLSEHTECATDVCYTEDFGSKAGWAATLGVSLAAPILAHLSGEGVSYTIGDARALRSFGVLGAQAVMPIAWQAFHGEEEDDDLEKAFVASIMAGSAAGIWLGNRALRDRSLSGGEGALVLAGHLAGGLGALGVTYLLDGGDDGGFDDSELLYLTTSAAGSVAGSLLTMRAVSSRSPRTAQIGGLSVELTPGAALLPLIAGKSERELRAPLLTIRF